MRNKSLAVFGSLLLSLAAVACAPRVKTVTDLPANVTQAQAQQWDKAVADLHAIAAVTSTVRQGGIALNHDGIFPDGPQYATFLQSVARIDQFQLAAVDLLKHQPDHFTLDVRQKVAVYIGQIQAEVVKLNSAGATGIKNQNSLATLNKQIAQIAASIVDLIALTQ